MKRNLKDNVLIIITMITVIIWGITMCMFDGVSIIPMIINIICSLWIIIFGLANSWFF